MSSLRTCESPLELASSLLTSFLLLEAKKEFRPASVPANSSLRWLRLRKLLTEKVPSDVTERPSGKKLTEVHKNGRISLVVGSETNVSGLGGRRVQEIKISLWRNAETQDWSLEILGKRHEHIGFETVNDLVEYVLLAAQQALAHS